jgi:hypothetical protein
MNGHSSASTQTLNTGDVMSKFLASIVPAPHGDESSTDATSGTDDNGSGSDTYDENSYP